MNKVQITPVMDMITGQARQDVEVYGPTEETIKKIPENFLVALGELGKGTDFDEVNDGAVSDIMRHLTEYKDTYGIESNPQALNALNARLHSLYPDMRNYRLVLGPKDKGNSWWRNMLNMPGTEWAIIPVTETITVYDSEGNEGKVYKDEESGKVHAASGAEIPGALNANEGDLIPSITFGQSPSRQLSSENITVGEKVQELLDFITDPESYKPDMESLRTDVKSIVAGGGSASEARIRKAAKGLAIEFGYSTAFWYDILINKPGYFIGDQLEKAWNAIMNIKLKKRKKK
jgi:hypothetical protein